MIRRLTANVDTFLPIGLEPGLNVLLADRDPQATAKHSRNARGKTTVIQAMNFCLAGNLIDPMKVLADKDWVFTLELDLQGVAIQVSRAIGRPSQVRVAWVGEVPGLLSPFLTSPGELSLADWKLVCGLGLFGLDGAGDAAARNLSVRTLLSYVLRLDATKDPIKILPQQSAVSAREHIAYFTGLNWSIPADLDRIRKSEEALKGLQYVAAENILSGLPSEEELLLLLADLDRRRAALSDQVTNFTVLDDRDGLLFQADELTRQLVTLRDASLIDRRLIAMYEDTASVDEQGSVAVADVETLYEDLERTFVEGARVELESVEVFHAALQQNRQSYIERELELLRRGDAERTAHITRLEHERARMMRIIASSGAIDELIALQESLSVVIAEHSQALAALATIRESKQRRQELRLQKAELRSAASVDLVARQDEVDTLSAIFSSLLHRLYGRGGVISTDVDDYGPRFKVSVDSASSAGVSKMQLLCFDLALMMYAYPRGRHPGFLVHDSFVFDGVDSRQVTEALKMIGEVTAGTGMQYVCTLNSDAVVTEERREDWFVNSVRRQVMDTEVGGFLGVNF